MICTWCHTPIRAGEEVSLNALQRTEGLVYCTSACLNNNLRYYNALGSKPKALPENRSNGKVTESI